MIRALNTFVSVARRGTFAAAGQHVGLTQSAVSAQIKTLEASLGVQLFERSARAATLNAAGQRALPMAEQILALYQGMGNLAAADGYHGRLRIGAIGTAQTGLLPAALAALRTAAPAVEVTLVPGVSLNLVNQLDAGELDLALVIRPPFALPKGLHCDTLSREPFVLIAPLGTPAASPRQLLENQPFIRYDRSSFGGRRVTQFLNQQHIEVHQVLELDELDAIARMVQTGLGVALLPLAGLWLEHRERLQIIELGELAFDRELVLVQRSSQRQQPLHQLLQSCLHGA